MLKVSMKALKPLAEPRRRDLSNLLVKPLPLKCWWGHVVVVRRRCREDPPAKVFDRGDVGVDAEGVGKAPRGVVLAEASRRGSQWLLAKALLQMCLEEEILV
jgi:hypothetical protein